MIMINANIKLLTILTMEHIKNKNKNKIKLKIKNKNKKNKKILGEALIKGSDKLFAHTKPVNIKKYPFGP